MAGLKNKDKDFWEGLREWEVIVLIETWMEEGEWGKWRDRLPEGFKWKMQGARRRSKKGRAIRGMLLGIRKEKAVGRDEGGRSWKEL